MLINRTQSQVSISGLTYNNLLEDAYNAIKDSDEFKNTFSQFTSNEAARLIAELYAYMATQLATRMDQMGNELFVDTASSYGLSRLLKLVGAKIDFPAAASTDVTVSTSATTDTITFTSGIGTDKNGNDLVFLPNSFKSITANNGTSWEFIECKVGENGEYVYDYTTQYKFNAPSQTFTIYEGTTRSFNYTIRSINTDIITLPNNSVIKDSVRIYYRQKSTKPGTDNAWEIREFKKVDNFFTTSALTAKTGIYTIRNMGSGRCEICLKPYYNNETSESDIGKELLIMYRTGGGADGNIAIGSITKTERFNTLGNNGTTVTGVGELTITNIKTGLGGKDELTTDEIRSTVINEVRNTKIAITEEDYEYLLPKYDSDVSLLKCYGEKNEETADLAETYGYYVNPIAVWLIILKYNKEFYDAYMDGENGLTGRINDISFNTLDINPRFDEQYQVNSASINQVYKVNDLQNNCYDESSWQYTLDIDPRGVDVILKGNAKITVTTSPYIDSSVSSKRAEHCFDRYTGDAEPIDTWAELMELSSVQEGKVYRVAGADPNGMLNGRWKCISAISEVIDPSEYNDYWKRLDFVYLYDNFVSVAPESTDVDDTMYIEQTGADEFTTTYSYLNGSFSASWGDLLKKYGSSGSAPITLDDITLTINGIDINFDGDEFYSLNDLAEFINDRSNPATNYVSLKDHIANLSDVTDPSNVTIESAAGTTLGVPEIQLTLSGGSAVNYQVTTTGVSTYGALLDAINDALGEDSPYRAVFNQNASNECWDLWIICEQQFSYKDSSTSGTTAIYRYLLNHDSYDGSAIGSQKYNLSYDQVDEWEGFIISDGDAIVEVVGTSLVLCFSNGQSTIQITGVNSGPLREAFGLSIIDDDVHTRIDNRNITVSLVTSEDSNKASVVITMSSENEKINKDVYINVFGGENEDITLGSYYANIEDNLPSDTSQTIIDLLKRKPLKSLYSTSYNTSGASPVIDKYGCNYQLKFSTGLVGEKTYNELSSGNSPAYVDTTKASYDTLRQFNNNEYLYLKVDGIEYSGEGSFTIGNEQPITVPEEGGYAKFDLDWFNSKTVSNFAYAIVKTFETEGPGGTPLIDYISIDDDYIRIYTNSAAYYSSLDFGLTQANTISYLFGTNDSIVYSEEGQIDVEQITYSSLSLTSYPAIGRTMNITYTSKNGSQEISRDVAIGYSLASFASNLAASDINKDDHGDYVPRIVFDNNRIILADLSNTAKMKVTVQWNNQTEKSAWEKMFTDSSWNDFIIIDDYQKTEDARIVEGKTYYTRSGSDPDYVYTPVENPVEEELGNYYEKSATGSAYCEYTNSGDYYVNLEEDEEGNNVYKLIIENPDKFPFGNIYVHMYEDYSFDHVVSDDYGIITYTDEYNWNNLMTDRRVMLTEHIYKQPRFIPFDLALTCTLPNTETFSQVDYNAELKTFLRNNYGIYSDNIGKEIRPDDIILSIKDSFSKIINVTVDYLGYNMLSDITNKTKLETKFNQQHIIASDDTSIEAIQDPDTGLITFDSVAKHGIKLTFKYS